MTNILILGANGQIARVATDLFLERSDARLTLYLRNARRLRISGHADRVRVVEGDVLDIKTLEAAMAGQDVVYANLAGDLEQQARCIVKTMQKVGIKRLIFISSMGIYDEIPGEHHGSILDPYRKAASIIEASDLDYTIIRPAWLNNRNEIDYATTYKGEPFKNPSAQVSRKSVADLVVKLAMTPGLEVRASLGVHKALQPTAAGKPKISVNGLPLVVIELKKPGVPARGVRREPHALQAANSGAVLVQRAAHRLERHGQPRRLAHGGLRGACAQPPSSRCFGSAYLIPRSGPFGYSGRVKKMWTALSILAVVAALILAGCRATRAGYESAPYKVVRLDGKFELRDYPALRVVETPMARAGNDADGSFMRLFRFITGANEAKQKIAMTTPVFMSGSDTNATMAFVLPAKLKPDAVPKPSDATVTVRELPAGRFAVLRFSGGRSAKHDAEALGRLRAWMEAEGLKELSPPVYGYFDPPWTPGFLRRNEVMLRTEGEK